LLGDLMTCGVDLLNPVFDASFFHYFLE